MRRLAFLGPALLAGCTVGPNYRPPDAAAPARFAEADAAVADRPAPALAGWWRSYRDPELERLVDLALADSPDVRIAAARIAQARAAVRTARAGFLPEVNGSGRYTYQRFSKNAGLSSLTSLFGGGGAGGGAGGGNGGGTGGGGTGGGIAAPGDHIETWSLGFDASWEIDLFGGTRRQLQGARARAEAAEWNARDAQLSLVAEVADAYFQLRTLQAREGVARAEVDRQQRNLLIAQNTARAGLIAEGDTVRQRADLATAEAAVGPIVAEGKAAMHALGVLTGRAPDALIEELAVPRPALPPPPGVPPGLPADLLRRRPDVRAAERDLAAATADVGVAVSDLYPRFSLTGAAQLISTSLATLFEGDSLQLNGSAAATFPVIDFGRRSGAVAGRRAQADEAYQTWRRTVLGALRDVEDALIRLRAERLRHEALARGLADARRAVAAVEARWRSGLTDYGDVLLARAAVSQGEDQLATSEGQLRRDLLALYKALGGGWEDLPLPTPAGDAHAYTLPKR
jgi:NodT family efflux transporter outer membrane factor (OMF) lipoprotein